MAAQIAAGTHPLTRDSPFTYNDYKSWPDSERWELINGKAFNMTPAPKLIHQSVLGQLATQLYNYFIEKPCRPNMAPVDVFLPEDDEALGEIEHIVQPDVFVVCDKTKLIDKGIMGAPDFIIEVLSQSTAMKDQTEKRRLYEARGVREYWIVNPDTLEVFMYLLKGDQYGLPSVADLREAVPVAIFPGLALKARPEDL